MRLVRLTIWVVLWAMMLPGPVGLAQDTEAIVLREGLVIPPVGNYGRFAVHQDVIEARLLVGQWPTPRVDDVVAVINGSPIKWTRLVAGDNGTFQGRELFGGYASFIVPSDVERTMVLEAAGHSMVYVNGAPRVGDPYQHGYVRVPVALRKGDNELLFHAGRGSLHAKLVAPKAAAVLNLADTTSPDLIVEEPIDTQAAVLVLNTTAELLDGLALEATVPGGQPVVTTLPPLVPLQVRKSAVRLQAPAIAQEGTCEVQLSLVRQRGDQRETLDSAQLALRVVRPDQTHKRTFVSRLDGSVQYYGQVPARPVPAAALAARPGLVLTLHGAGVEAIGQASSYAAKSDLHIVAATNRRPFGFDWEDWGRLDALEVLELSQRLLATDPARTYLTGHSMGGHGTWQVGVHFPDRFAAIGPSAGWVSMWSYAGGIRSKQPDPVTELMERAAMASDTLALARNYQSQGIYVLHGDRDDNVPVDQARSMRQLLATFHPDFAYHEEPGMGHWWGKEGISGAACVDWPPLFEFFRPRKLSPLDRVNRISFVTASPGVSAWCYWVGIEDQLQRMKISNVEIECDREHRKITGKTSNVARLAIDVGHMPPDQPVSVQLDDQKLESIAWPARESGTRLSFTRRDGRWAASERAVPRAKGPHRYGLFKDAFRNNVVLVYGTHGQAEENARLLAKARFDSESFWYRGNASLELVSDEQFVKSCRAGGTDYLNRNVVLYGNADNNSAWPLVLTDSPVDVRSGRIRVGDRELAGEDLACLFVQPRSGDDTALVGVVGSTGVRGIRVTERLPYFISGVGFPDCVVMNGDVFIKGLEGVRGAGYFGAEWDVASGEFAWRDAR